MLTRHVLARAAMNARARFALAPIWLVAAGLAIPGAAAERVLFRRAIPTDVTWGELSIIEGGPTEIVVRGEKLSYPFTLEVACDERRRREDPDDEGKRAAVTPVTRRGAVYLAVQLPDGRDAWKQALEKVRLRIADLTPDTFESFVQSFGNVLNGADPAVTGAFRGVACTTVEGRSDAAGEYKREIDGGNVRSGWWGFSDPRPICSALAAALEAAPPSSVLTSRFEVRVEREQELTVADARVTGHSRSAWPEGAGIAYAAPPEGSTGYTWSGGGDGEARYDELRPARRGGPPETEKPYLLKSRAKNAALPREGLDGDALLARWTWRVRHGVLGAEPSSTIEEESLLDVAFLFMEEHAAIDWDGAARAVAQDLARSSEAPGIPLLVGLVKSHTRELGTDAVVAVFCERDRPREATYCVAQACASVLNAEEFCRALGDRLDVIAGR